MLPPLLALAVVLPAFAAAPAPGAATAPNPPASAPPSGSAVAAAPAEAPAPPPVVATAAELARLVQGLQRRVGTPVLVAGAGPDAEQLAIAAEPLLPPMSMRVMRVGWLGDPEKEVRRALDLAGLRCAVRVAPAPVGGMTVTEHGECVAVTTGAAAADAAPVGPAPAPPPPDPAVLESTFALARLSREAVVRDDHLTWIVKDGRGMALDAGQFARRVGDASVQQRLDRSRATASTLGWGLGVSGGALVVASLGVLASRNGNEPDSDDYELSALDFPSSADYREAQEQADADYARAQDQWQIRREDRGWTAGFLALGGLVCLGAAPFAAEGAEARAADAALWWDEARADAMIAAYNAALRASLTLPAADTEAAAPPPSTRAVEDDTLEDLEEPDDVEGTPDDPPAAPTAPLPLAPERHLQVRPVLAPGWAGISGRF